jgi:hypothetical protein
MLRRNRRANISALFLVRADPKSLIEQGSGYWKYEPTENGVRFLTWYDYKTRFGAPRKLFDRLIFRPLMGWATAWSFDRLRLWIDRAIRPEASLRMSLIHALARFGIAFIWIWQGLVPKLALPNAGEKTMLSAAGLPQSMLPVIGALELAIGASALAAWR